MPQQNQGLPPLNMPVVISPLGTIASPWYLFFINLWTRTGSATGGATFESGDIKAAAYGTLPAGWLSCDGSAVSRNVYASLFSAIGITWGQGDMSSTFNLPNLQGKTLLGLSSSIPLGSSATVGAVGSAAVRYAGINYLIKT